MRLIESYELNHVFGGAPDGGYEVSVLVVEANPKTAVSDEMLNQLWSDMALRTGQCMGTSYLAQQALQEQPKVPAKDLKPLLTNLIAGVVLAIDAAVACDEAQKAAEKYADARQRYDDSRYDK